MAAACRRPSALGGGESRRVGGQGHRRGVADRTAGSSRRTNTELVSQAPGSKAFKTYLGLHVAEQLKRLNVKCMAQCFYKMGCCRERLGVK